VLKFATDNESVELLTNASANVPPVLDAFDAVLSTCAYGMAG